MLFALRQPETLLGLLLGYAVSLIALSGVTRLLDRNLRHPAPFWDPKSWLDPYAAVAALLGGVGWAPKAEARRGFGRSRNRQLCLLAALSCVVPAALGAGAIAGYRALAGRGALPLMDSMSVLHGGDFTKLIAPTFAEKLLLGFGVESAAIGLLSLVPIPPLPTGVAVWTILPRTAGARQMAYRLLEEYWGVIILLVLFIVPLAGEQPLLLALVTSVIDGIVHSI
ncbi:MAG TPA: hypothetical protein VHB69_04490 [Mycobacteriales bacterium]|nr:hypothetical protein [Mycobacteriales bacterium]